MARADRMCELEWILLSHDKLKLRKNGPMESGSICTVASPMERRASLIVFLLLGLFATAGIERVQNVSGGGACCSSTLPFASRHQPR